MAKNADENTIKVNITKDERRVDGWVSGEATGEIWFCAKAFDEGSVFGINKGCVSKLDIRRGGEIIVNYDRGWDIRPQDPEVRAVYKRIMTALNALNKVFEIDKPKDSLAKIEGNKQKVSRDTSEKPKKTKGDELC
jgi:hypothetical protein